VRDDMIQVVNVEEFTKADIDWTTWNVWDKYTFDTLQGTILEITEETVTIDFNHFLAWKDLIFTVTINEINN
jgi:FKBP-type peptidyl-prolyl cis-trans isomerase 2